MADVKICDRCGKELTNTQTLINIRPVRYILDEQVFECCLGWIGRRSKSSFDLCVDCEKRLREFLNGPSEGCVTDSITEATDAVVKE